MARIIIIVFAVLLPLAATAGTFPFYLQWDDSTSNVTDISYLNHKPAGVSGPVTSLNGHTYINSGTERIKFFGTNVTSSSCFPDKTDAPKIAKRMAKFGINLVRFHLADTWQWGDSVFLNAASGGDTRTLDLNIDGTVDRMEYFMKCLIDEGIYININMLAGRKFKSADGLPASIDGMDWKDVQTPAMFYPGMLDLQKEYATNILSHVNQYTGLAMKDNPAVAFVEVCNEHGLLHAWYNHQMDSDRLPSEFRDDLASKWNTYLHGVYVDHNALKASWELSQPLGSEMLANGDFSSGMSSWTFQEFAPAAGGTAYETDGYSPGIDAMHVTVTSVSSEVWHIQFYQAGLNMIAGIPYTISFSAKADSNRDIIMVIEQAGDPWGNMGVSKVLSLTDQWQRFEFTVSVSFSDTNARLNFRNMADETGVYSFADISLREGGSIGLEPGEDLDSDAINAFDYDDVSNRTAAAKSDWIDFLWELEETYWTGMNDHLKNTLSIQGLTMGTVIGNSTPNLMNIFDVIDSHAYYHHPSFPDSGQWSIVNGTMVDETDGLTISGLSMKKVTGKPFSVTEYNHPFPLSYDSEAYFFLGAYAALHDWDAIYPYTYDDGTRSWDTNMQNGFFEMDRHPGKIISWIHAALMFRRGDVSPASDVVTVPMNIADEKNYLLSAEAWSLVDASFAGMERETGLIYRTEIVPEGGTNPAGALSPGSVSVPVDHNYISQTGEINWNASGSDKYITLDSPRTKFVLGSIAGMNIDLEGFIFRLQSTLQNWAAISVSVIDGESLTSNANNILLSAHGAVTNAGMKYYDFASFAEIPFPPARGQAFYTNQWGTGPSLGEGISCEIVVPYAWDYVKVYSLDSKGDRVASLPVSNESGNAVFSINDTYQTLMYEIEIYTGSPAPTDSPTLTSTATETPGGPTKTPTETATETPTVSTVLIDDLEDNDAQNELGGYWYTYSDPLSTMAPVPGIYINLGGGAGGSNYCAAMQGNIAPVVTATPAGSPVYSYCGLGTSLSSDSGFPTCSKTNISIYTGIMFDVYGDGKDYMITLPYSDAGCNSLTNDDNYKYIFSASASWTQYKIPFSAFTQEGWGSVVSLSDVLQNASELQFQTVYRGIAYDLRVDNLAFYNEVSIFTETETTTETATYTQTPTETETETAMIQTETYTSTMTYTYTITFTPTYTMTFTPTETFTMTQIPTMTETPTRSPRRNLDHVYAYPSAYRGDSESEGIRFINLTRETKLQIYNVNGEIVHSFSGNTPSGEYMWKLNGKRRTTKISPGMYVYVLVDEEGRKMTGKVVVIK